MLSAAHRACLHPTTGQCQGHSVVLTRDAAGAGELLVSRRLRSRKASCSADSLAVSMATAWARRRCSKGQRGEVSQAACAHSAEGEARSEWGNAAGCGPIRATNSRLPELAHSALLLHQLPLLAAQRRRPAPTSYGTSTHRCRPHLRAGSTGHAGAGREGLHGQRSNVHCVFASLADATVIQKGEHGAWGSQRNLLLSYFPLRRPPAVRRSHGFCNTWLACNTVQPVIITPRTAVIAWDGNSSENKMKTSRARQTQLNRTGRAHVQKERGWFAGWQKVIHGIQHGSRS